MNAKKHLSNVWLKASVLGCLWASSEIVIGSFLHNLRVPFCGNILTGIGIVIMVSVGQIWTERGLFWRTGLVCALMKSISPSAIIFGPMLGIFTEALLMEISTFAFRKSIIAFLIGGALAMSWNLVQMLLGYVITYGSDIILLYEKLAEFFHRQLGIVSENYWWPIEIVLIFYLAAGLLFAAIGIYIGRVAGKKETTAIFSNNTSVNSYRLPSTESQGNFSLVFLFVNITMMIAALTIFNLRILPLTASLVIVFATFWILKYPKVLRPLKKPGFWIFLLITTALSAYLFNLSTGKNDGWIIGAEMNLRAIVMILGFAVIGKELRNPVISNWFHRIGLRQLPAALELAFESLPAVISSMPGWKDITHRPVSSFLSYVHKADAMLKEQEKIMNEEKRMVIITGDRSEGKTSFLEKIILLLKEDKVGISGFLSSVTFEDGVKKGYDLLNLETGERTVFIRTEEFPGSKKFRKYYFGQEGLIKGKRILSELQEISSSILIIDEVGPWELEDKGWAAELQNLLSLRSYRMVWVIRKEILEDALKKWKLQDALIIDVANVQVSEAKMKILEFFS
jgi:nucleoside-triphosphatase THEP1